MADRETFTVNSVPLFLDGAWRATDLAPLRARSVRGDDLVIPGRGGVLGRGRERDSVQVVLPFVVFGSKDENGDPHSDVGAGVWANLDYLATQILADSVGTVTGTFTFRDDTTVSGDVKVLDMEVGALGDGVRGAVNAPLTVLLVDGRLS